MDPMDRELGRRDFLRSAALLGTGVGVSTLMGACSERGEELPTTPARDLVNGRKWIRIDSTDMQTGELTSLDGFSDTLEGAFSSDVELSGHVVLASGDIIPMTAGAEKDCANSLSLRSLGGSAYQLEAGGVPYPFGAPFEIHLVERTIPGTEVIVLTGYSYDPSTGKRVLVNVTHDPLVWVAVVIGLVTFFMLVEVAHAPGLPACRKRRRGKIRNGPSPSGSFAGVGATTGSPTIVAECTDECPHDQGGGG